MPRLFRHSLTAAALAALFTISHPSAQTTERFTAAAINMNRGVASNIDIVVNRYSTDGERDRLMSVMLERGPEKLLDTLQSLPRVGYFRTPDSIGWDIHFARKTRGTDGGERITLITDRRIGFWEASRQPRSFDYPFTVIELRLNGDGEGEGKMSIATKIMYDDKKNEIVLENYQSQPVLLTEVRQERKTAAR
jgi:hypothetical protein